MVYRLIQGTGDSSMQIIAVLQCLLSRVSEDKRYDDVL